MSGRRRSRGGTVAVVVLVAIAAIGLVIWVAIADAEKGFESLDEQDNVMEVKDFCDAYLGDDFTVTEVIEELERSTGSRQESTASLLKRSLQTDKDAELQAKLNSLSRAIDESLESGSWDGPLLLATDIDATKAVYC